MSSPPRTPITVGVVALVVASAAVAGLAVTVSATALDDASETTATAGASADDQFRAADANASVDAWRVPHSVDATNATELVAYRTENATDPVGVTPADRLAITVHVDGLDARVADGDGNLTENVLAALNESGEFAVLQTEETTSPERRLAALGLNASNVRAVDAPGDDSYVLVVDPDELAAARVNPFDDTDFADLDEQKLIDVYDDWWDVREFTARYYANDSYGSLAASSAPIAFQRPTATLDPAGPLMPTRNATVTGSTTVAPGTDLVVTARIDGEPVDDATVAVEADGTFTATLDLAGVDAPANASFAVARADYRTGALATDSATARVLEPTAAVTFEDQTTSTQYVYATANLSHGGVLVLRNETGVVDVSNPIEPGSNQTVTFSLGDDARNQTLTVDAYRLDDDGDRGARYANASTSARVAVEPDHDESTTTARTTTSSATTRSTQTTSTTTTTVKTFSDQATPTTADTETADGPIPGFGVLVALAALVATGSAVAARTGRFGGEP